LVLIFNIFVKTGYSIKIGEAVGIQISSAERSSCRISFPPTRIPLYLKSKGIGVRKQQKISPLVQPAGLVHTLRR